MSGTCSKLNSSVVTILVKLLRNMNFLNKKPPDTPGTLATVRKVCWYWRLDSIFDVNSELYR